MMHCDPLDVWVRPDEQCAALTAGYRLLQRNRGHRYSVDDMLVAHLACEKAPSATRVLDLGCGVGSVLLMMAWAMPQASFVGIEAQDESVALARRNLVLNDCVSRVKLHHGDLRELAQPEQVGTFDLVTGTPPYFDPLAATPCADPQKAYARFELRGGIEDYARAASRVLAPQGLFVACGPAEPQSRVFEAVAAAGLHVHWWQAVVPRELRPAFLKLVACGRHERQTEQAPDLILRHEDGRRTAEHAARRTRFGLAASEY